jgi:pyruvate/2-oxoglutarate dehydrogenase complex dihydrolipoamide acyltransferase (E2) component
VTVKSDQVWSRLKQTKRSSKFHLQRLELLENLSQEQQIIHVGETLVVLVDKGETYDPAAVSAASSTQEKPLYKAETRVKESSARSMHQIPKFSNHRSEVEVFPPSCSKNSSSDTNARKKLDLKVIGTGPNGLITDQDIQGAKGGVSTAGPSITSHLSPSIPLLPSQNILRRSDSHHTKELKGNW